MEIACIAGIFFLVAFPLFPGWVFLVSLRKTRKMYIYNVTVNLDNSIKDEWLQWMRSTHIPDVMSTGCFVSCRICKLLGVPDEGATYSIQYFFNAIYDMNRYQQKHAPRLQQEHKVRYGEKALAFRTLLEIIE